MNKLIMVLFSIISIFLYSCDSKSKKKKTMILDSSDSLKIENSFYWSVSMEKDTLDRKKQKGLFKMFFKLDDTLKVSNEDERSIYMTLGLIPTRDNVNKIDNVEKAIKKLIFSPINSNDTIKIPFTIIPNFSGKGKIIGIVTDKYFLNSYYGPDILRMLSYEQIFEKEVYIK